MEEAEFSQLWSDCSWREEIDSLRSTNASLKQQLEEAKADKEKHRLSCDKKVVELLDKQKAIHQQQLAAAQATNGKLREALEGVDDFVRGTTAWTQLQVDMLTHKLVEAIALPNDATALKQYRDSVIEECAKVCDLFEEKADALNDSISDDDDPNEGRSEWIMGKAAAASRIGKAIRNFKEGA